ncbi:hypothetical protein NEF87_002611 [Candidatus Lokiarchaeum ossiferum]|uniref:Uncharacterized protein n=1 Tax=Candidatus Lokiarchaeum ossiferum TaxID=2951803 RepID=A0ABY6HSD0_9ARCH|nr:hypothetical protein NEF87_002611 [Candidatus Lokiarchaeum sp. B-35]
MIEAVLISDGNGIPLFTHFFSKQFIDPNLLLSFFSALKTFARSMSQEANNKLRSIKLGKYLFDFESSYFEQFEQEVDVLVITTGLPPSFSHALIDEISESFLLFLDENIVENPEYMKSMKIAQYPNLSHFSNHLNNLILKTNSNPNFRMHSVSNIPNTAFSIINYIFSQNSNLAESYDFSEQELIEQFIDDYCKNQLINDIQKKFNMKSREKFNPWD